MVSLDEAELQVRRSRRVAELARRLNVRWEVRDDLDGSAYALGGLIATGPLRDQYAYLQALHELGHHVVLKDAGELESLASNELDRELDREVFSWRWAIGQAGERLEAESVQGVLASLAGYVDKHERLNRRRRTPRSLDVALSFCAELEAWL